MKHLFYFGCIRSVGHYFYASESDCSIRNPTTLGRRIGAEIPYGEAIFWKIDGGYAPKSSIGQGAYKESFVDPFRIIAWHDYTVDRRPGSNSALLGVGYDSVAEMLADAAIKFPSVMARQTGLLREIAE